ncbi:MMPL family transporter [Catenulispora pinisilvae]|uniref:MMPL family transporter n=1 Tax=Catenulispora pinisilvae TaxID=2705253 RepID=UPI001891660A|nr:MMPL family transporter [Catenulispora pinisilvae]
MSTLTARPPVVERVAGWSARHRKTTVIGWLVLIIAAVVIGGMASGTKKTAYDPGEAGRAERALDVSGISQETESVLVQSKSGASFATDPDFRSGVSDVAAALRAIPGSAAQVRSPLDNATETKALLSKDGRSALVTFVVAGNKDDADKTVAKPLATVAQIQAAHPGLRVEEAGSASVDKTVNDIISTGLQRAEVSSVPVTLVLLLLVFGALVAASIPLLLALTAVVAGISLMSIPGHWVPISDSTSSVVLLIGMAVGVDYSLFYIRREREERALGKSPREALRIAASTSGRSIVVSGLTVMACLGGLFFTQMDAFSGWSVGTILVVGMAMLGSVTVVPAMLSWLGDKLDKGRVPFVGKRRTVAKESRFWNFLVRNVVKRPLLWGTPAFLALLALAVTGMGLKAKDSGGVALTYGKPISQTLERMQTAFPGGPAPAQLMVHGDPRVLKGPEFTGAVAAMERMLPNGAQVTTETSADGSYEAISVPLAGDGADSASAAALKNLRSQVLPATLGHVSGIEYNVGGQAAGQADFGGQLSSRTPIVIGFVLLLAFVLMVAAFRSLAIPLTAIAVNLLSVGASYGVVKWIFQDGHLEKQLGFQSYGAVISWLPLFMFVILFGLSMDYHVFILSRVRELRLRGASTKQAVVRGVSSSSGVVSSAALIMVAVFSLFAFMPFAPMKMVGIGMAVAVAIDATLVRGLLVPAIMSLLGDRNWELPRALQWMPGLAMEKPAVPEPAAAPAYGRHKVPIA